MVLVAAAVAVLVVLVVALVAVGREAFTLASQPRQALFDVDEAVDFVADNLPHEITAHVSYDDVRTLIRWHLELLAAAGTPANRWDAAGNRFVVVDDEEGAEILMTRALDAGLDLTPDDVAGVLAAELAYFEAIGAVGPPARDALPPGEPTRYDDGHT